MILDERDVVVETVNFGSTQNQVKMTHTSTGIVVVCNEYRSQYRNRKKALEMLREKLAELK